MKRLPQVLINVKGVDKSRVDSDATELLTAVKVEEAALDDAGRVLLRKSGTEPVVRVMVEAAEAGAGQGGRRAARRCRAGAALPLTRGIRTAAYGSPGITRTR